MLNTNWFNKQTTKFDVAEEAFTVHLDSSPLDTFIPKDPLPLNDKFLDISRSSDNNLDKSHEDIIHPVTTMSAESVLYVRSPRYFYLQVNKKKFLKYFKIGALTIIWLIFTIFLMIQDEKKVHFHNLNVPSTSFKLYEVMEKPPEPRLEILMDGSFIDVASKSNSTFFLEISYAIDVEGSNAEEDNEDMSEIFRVRINPNIDHSNLIRKSHTFQFNEETFLKIKKNKSQLFFTMKSNFNEHLPLMFAYNSNPINKDTGFIIAIFILIGLYILIIWEWVHRTFAAMLASTLAIASLAAMNAKPSMDEIISWIDFETLMLLLSMMILVAIISETGIFDYLTVYACQITKGKIWPLIIYLSILTAILSMVLDSVTTILLMTPVIIRICEVKSINPRPVLITMIIACNIGGVTTPIGDPPNMMIISNAVIANSGISFFSFVLHMFPGVLVIAAISYFIIKFKFNDLKSLSNTDPIEIEELRHEIVLWERTAGTVGSCSRDEQIVKKTIETKIDVLDRKLKQCLQSSSNESAPVVNLESLKKKYPLKNKQLLIKSGIVMSFVFLFFILHSFPNIQRLSFGWTTLFGVILLIIITDRKDFDSCLSYVEWSTLIFIASLFILMECLEKLGFIDWMEHLTINFIKSVSEPYRLTIAILFVLWLSALVSAFMDNIPLTSMMIRIIITLSNNQEIQLPLLPLVYALVFGSGLGGNGTLIGSSATIVCAGVAEQHGYKITFMEFFKIGIIIMIVSVTVASFYLLFCHVVLAWN